ncbi:unnamed protein product [Vitrella brassicaformis CCMP3155]|uniref:Uncharacterized protein n=1 Tax=Vitrella brassicaformis (strain CCMP3155) TaxID=1169540 RepID=A0A0G4EUD9_VITBC|nr:unnamed protein product [Vitrella brassicaformis CCMP3155]|eukprot:CEM01705.1 unnamed protein product [Vitrella brassicaformis CCMP3155]
MLERFVDRGVFIESNRATKRLAKAVFHRTITSGGQVTTMIRQRGADPNWLANPRVRGSDLGVEHVYSILALAVDNMTDHGVPSILAQGPDNGLGNLVDESPVAMPMWPTRGLQDAVMRALIEGGANVNGRGDDEGEDDDEESPRHSIPTTPMEVAIASGNDRAVNLLMGQDGLQLRSALGVPRTLPTDRPTEAHEAWLLSTYQRLIDHDNTVAAQDGGSRVHSAAYRHSPFSQAFFNKYIDLLVANGADVAEVDEYSQSTMTSLHRAALMGSHHIVTSLCRHLTDEGVDIGTEDDPDETPLALAAKAFKRHRTALQNNEWTDFHAKEIPFYPPTIRALLRAGADIDLMLTDTPEERALVLPESTAVLNEVPTAAMAAVNAALRPQRASRPSS